MLCYSHPMDFCWPSYFYSMYVFYWYSMAIKKLLSTGASIYRVILEYYLFRASTSARIHFSLKEYVKPISHINYI